MKFCLKKKKSNKNKNKTWVDQIKNILEFRMANEIIQSASSSMQ